MTSSITRSSAATLARRGAADGAIEVRCSAASNAAKASTSDSDVSAGAPAAAGAGAEAGGACAEAGGVCAAAAGRDATAGADFGTTAGREESPRSSGSHVDRSSVAGRPGADGVGLGSERPILPESSGSQLASSSAAVDDVPFESGIASRFGAGGATGVCPEAAASAGVAPFAENAASSRSK